MALSAKSTISMGNGIIGTINGVGLYKEVHGGSLDDGIISVKSSLTIEGGEFDYESYCVEYRGEEFTLYYQPDIDVIYIAMVYGDESNGPLSRLTSLISYIRRNLDPHCDLYHTNKDTGIISIMAEEMKNRGLR